MNREERLKYCKYCIHSSMNWEKGLICKFTGKQADFEDVCPNYNIDEEEKQKREKRLEDSFNSQKASQGVNVGSIIWGIVFIVGGISGRFVLRGTNSSIALAVVGVIMILYQLFKDNDD